LGNFVIDEVTSLKTLRHSFREGFQWLLVAAYMVNHNHTLQ